MEIFYIQYIKNKEAKIKINFTEKTAKEYIEL